MTKQEERAKMVVAMDYIISCLNDEDQMTSWLMGGVPDGDIDHNKDWTTDYNDEYFTDDRENFSDLMRLFLKTMNRAYNAGGLYCGGVVSR